MVKLVQINTHYEAAYKVVNQMMMMMMMMLLLLLLRNIMMMLLLLLRTEMFLFVRLHIRGGVSRATDNSSIH